MCWRTDTGALGALSQTAHDKSIANLDFLLNNKGSTSTAELRLKMQNSMQLHAAVFREQDTLEEGCRQIDALVQEQSDLKVTDKSLVWNTDLIETLELQNLMVSVRKPRGSGGCVCVMGRVRLCSVAADVCVCCGQWWRRPP